MAFNDIFETLKGKVTRAMGDGSQANKVPEIPVDRTKQSSFLDELYQDAKNFRNTHYFNRLGYTSFTDYLRDCYRLDAGDHWMVWGTRKKDANDDWKAELVENEISNQNRVIVAYLTANWHRFDVLPNIANINEIINQEQKKTYWDSTVTELVKRQVKYGSCILKSILDTTTDHRGVATETVCDNAGVFLSPFSKSIRRSDGCWYFIHATLKPKWEVLVQYRDSIKALGVDPDKITALRAQRYDDLRPANTSMIGEQFSYTHASLTDVYEFWMDDFENIETPFSEDEFNMSLGQVLQGVEAPVLPSQNHKIMVEKYMGYIAEKNSMASVNPLTEDDHQMLSNVNTAIANQVEKHLQYRTDGLSPKYPFGRKMVRAGGVVVEDVPNPFQFDWRKLIHWIDFECVDGQVWGRGNTEILWHANKSLDLMKSRIADMGLNAVPEMWLEEANRRVIEKDGLTKDPSKAHFYVGNPPIFPQSRAPVEFLETFKLDKEDAQRNRGINTITYGIDPTGDISGKAISALTSQNAITVTGEANNNLNTAIAGIIETRLRIMKQFYTEPRKYWIAGQWQTIVVAQILSEQPVVENGEVMKDPATGEPIMQAIPDIEVAVQPKSNLPNQWEQDLGLFTKLMSLPADESGLPVIPRQAIYDVLADKYAEFAAGGKYAIMSEATKIGLDVMRQQQELEAQQAEQQNMTQDAIKSIRRRKIKESLESQIPQNGERK
jgi:hypothetical protein